MGRRSLAERARSYGHLTWLKKRHLDRLVIHTPHCTCGWKGRGASLAGARKERNAHCRSILPEGGPK